LARWRVVDGGCAGCSDGDRDGVGAVGTTPGVGGHRCGHRGDDTLVVLTPSETSYMYAILEQPRSHACSVPGFGRFSRVISVMNRICGPYKLRNRVIHLQLKWLLWNATRFGGCGAFVIDDASWRRARIRAAESWSNAAQNWMPHVSTNLGQADFFRTKKGNVKLTCTEYANPARQSPLLRPTPQPVPPQPRLPSLPGGDDLVDLVT
jgi:hypothetical protein